MHPEDDDELSHEDRALFRDSVKGATPLGEQRPTSLPVKKPKKKVDLPLPIVQKKSKISSDKWDSLATQQISQNRQPLAESVALSDHSPYPVSGEGLLEYSDSGISQKDMRRLKDGDFPVEGALDLHGTTTEEARHALLSFLDHAQNRGWRCVRIVHGKGKHGSEVPIIKNLVNSWLRQLPPILAFCSTPRRDGGAGAVYVLISRNV
jgi:DNA-nicking Smr family endonuclease